MATSSNSWKPVKKFKFLYHGTTSHNTKSIRQHGLMAGSYVTTHPGIAAVEAAAKSVGYHPIMGSAIELGDALMGMTAKEALKHAKRVEKRAIKLRKPFLGANKQVGSWGMIPGTRDRPLVFAIKREGLKGFKHDPEYVGSAHGDETEWTSPVRRFSFISKKKIPPSHIVKVLRWK